MRLLIITQAIDTEDPVLGFFVRWLEEFAKHVERIEVICLREGRHALPTHVRVHSLGKERGVSRMGYLLNFYRFIWQLRHDYDAVFVHMNQEYILLGGPLWRLFSKGIYLWRNHYAGSWITDAAAFFCTKVFCTSTHSYTAKYDKTVMMPVGVDIERFDSGGCIERKSHSILFLARMAPSKHPEVLIEALSILAQRGIDFSASLVGSPLKEDEAYYAALKEKVRTLALDQCVLFLPGVPNKETLDLYHAHEIFVNASPSGMFDKTIFEAAVSGCLVLSSSTDVAGITGSAFTFGDAEDLAKHLVHGLSISGPERVMLARSLKDEAVRAHSLTALGDRLAREIGVYSA